MVRAVTILAVIKVTCVMRVVIILAVIKVTCVVRAVITMAVMKLTCVMRAVIILTVIKVTCVVRAVITLAVMKLTCVMRAVIILAVIKVTCVMRAVTKLVPERTAFQKQTSGCKPAGVKPAAWCMRHKTQTERTESLVPRLRTKCEKHVNTQYTMVDGGCHPAHKMTLLKYCNLGAVVVTYLRKLASWRYVTAAARHRGNEAVVTVPGKRPRVLAARHAQRGLCTACTAGTFHGRHSGDFPELRPDFPL